MSETFLLSLHSAGCGHRGTVDVPAGDVYEAAAFALELLANRPAGHDEHGHLYVCTGDDTEHAMRVVLRPVEEVVAQEDAAEEAELVSASRRVTCHACNTWATAAHLASQDHEGALCFRVCCR